jgi:GntR family transcriptional regulator
MLLNLTDLSDEPLQSQISRQIRAKILAGELTAGELLPSIRGLAREVHVSVITVQRGYEQLERDGLIHSRRGKGFFVSEIREGRKKDMARHKFIQDLKPLLAEAFAEGMTGDEIMAAFTAMLTELKQANRMDGRKGEKS